MSVLTVLCAMGTACVAEVGDTQDGELELVSAVAELDETKPFFQFTWTQTDGGTAILAPVDDYWCALTGITGYFRGLGEEVRVYKSNDGLEPTWRITVKSLQSQGNVGGTATCYRRDQISEASNLNLVSAEYSVSQTSRDECDKIIGCPVVNVPDPAPALTKTWQGDAVTVITGISGNFRGWGEFVQVNQAFNPADHTTIGAQNLKSEVQTSRVWAHVFFAGFKAVPPSHLAPVTSEAKITDAKTLKTQLLRSVGTHMCYLTYIGGSLNKQTSIGLKPKNGVWELSVKGTPSDPISGGARCVKLDWTDLEQ